jgi:Alpha galactosidase A/NPCBM-associated, NEW3 domain of alpha-galactosidase/Alpha galactosidase C-terminal beta sandwich domain/Carbohydrate binding module (family 35)
MRRLIRPLVAVLAAASLTGVAAVSVGPAASAEDSGVGQAPLLGWSSWSFIRSAPTAAKIEAQASALRSSGLARAGFKYANLDDYWYQCPGRQGPNVDQYGRWVIDPARFPPGGSANGIQVVASYVHKLGLKFGLYVTPGISKQAVAENTPIVGTSYTAGQIATTAGENNYNCGGMVGIDYSKPGAQAFINSWADEFASWGIDYLKLDGVGSFDVPDVRAWSQALSQTGRPIHLELSNSLAIADAATWKQYSNGWRTSGDIECYGCETSNYPYPLTDWANVASRFDQVAAWQPYGGPGGFNDYDSLEIGNGGNDGLTPDERQTQMSLWALGASPLILGTDLTNLDATDLSYLENRAVLSVDQDAVDASRIVNTTAAQVFAKTEPGGDVVVGLFNTSSQGEVVSTTAAAAGLPASGAYVLDNLWSHRLTETGPTIGADVPPHGVTLLRVRPASEPGEVPPSTTVAVTGLNALTGGVPATATETFADNGTRPVRAVRLSLSAPAGWTVTPTSSTSFATVAGGQTAQATFQVVAPVPTTLFGSGTLSATADYRWRGPLRLHVSENPTATTSAPTAPPYLSYSSATDATAVFGQLGHEFGIVGAGADLYSGTDAYSSIYLKGAVGAASTVESEVVSQQNMNGFAKAGIMVRNDVSGSGRTPEGVVLFESPSGGIQLEWDSNGGTYLDSVTPPNGTIADYVPIWLELQRSGAVYTGYYSYDGKTWLSVGSATVPGQAATQDAGMFLTSHASGSPGQGVFSGFSVTGGATPPPLGTSYEAESPANTVAGGAVVATCPTCSGGEKVGFVGVGGTLTFNGVNAPTAGTYQVTVAYLDGSGRQAQISVNGAAPQTVSFTPTGSFSTVGTVTLPLQLAAGANTIEFANPAAYAPDFDRIIVPAAPS